MGNGGHAQRERVETLALRIPELSLRGSRTVCRSLWWRILCGVNDTSLAANSRYAELLWQRTPTQRLAIAMSLNRAVRTMRRYPGRRIVTIHLAHESTYPRDPE
jgi:hypothetical protein